MRILHLARSYPNPVTPTLGLWTAQPVAYIGRTCDVVVVSPVPYCPPLPTHRRLASYTRFRAVPRAEIRDGVTVYHPPFLVGPGGSTQCYEPAAYHVAIRRLVERLHAETSFDLVHAHFIHPDGVVAHRLARRLGIPFVVTDQAPWTPWLQRPCVRRLALPAARAAARITCVSNWLKRTIVDYVPEVSVDVIPNGFDDSLFTPGRAEERDPNLLLFVGFLNFNKGVDCLLHAMVTILEERPASRLALIGGSVYRNTLVQERQLRRLASQLDLDHVVEFRGMQPPDVVAAAMRRASVVVLPSRAETFGAVLVEALASGTPVVATRSGGPEDIVTDGVGRLVPVGNPYSLAEALLDVLGHRDRFQASALRSHALERYRWDAIADRYSALYRDIVARRKPVGVASRAT